MAIHHPTPPLGGGERPRLPSAQVGPVTQAIRAMRTAEPVKSGTVPNLPAKSGTAPVFPQSVEKFTHGIRAIPGVSRFEDHGIRTLSRTEVEDLIGGLIDLLDAMDGDTDLEDENEHGGDIQDEPHDPEEDMGAEEDEGSIGLVRFDGTNYSPWRRP